MKDHIPLPLPFIPGWDVSGVVEAVGSGTTKFEKGDEVYARPDVAAHGFGAYAEYMVVKKIETAQNRLTTCTQPRFLSAR